MLYGNAKADGDYELPSVSCVLRKDKKILVIDSFQYKFFVV